jgi:hypothetical protein
MVQTKRHSTTVLRGVEPVVLVFVFLEGWVQRQSGAADAKIELARLNDELGNRQAAKEHLSGRWPVLAVKEHKERKDGGDCCVEAALCSMNDILRECGRAATRHIMSTDTHPGVALRSTPGYSKATATRSNMSVIRNPVCGLGSMGCAALHARLLEGDRYAV